VWTPLTGGPAEVIDEQKPGAGYVAQKGYASYKANEITDSDFDLMIDKVGTISANMTFMQPNLNAGVLFHWSVLPMIEGSLRSFGEMHDASLTGLSVELPTFDEDGNVNGSCVLIDQYASGDEIGLRYYSELEETIARFGDRIHTYWGSGDTGAPVANWYNEGLTTLDIAKDWMSFAVDSFDLIKTVRLFLASLYFPSCSLTWTWQ